MSENKNNQSSNQVLFTPIIHAFETEPIADYWERLATANNHAVVQCSAERHLSVKSSCSWGLMERTSGLHEWEFMSNYRRKPCERLLGTSIPCFF